MNHDAAIRLIEETLDRPFDEGRFAHFASNLLNEIDRSKATGLVEWPFPAAACHTTPLSIFKCRKTPCIPRLASFLLAMRLVDGTVKLRNLQQTR